MNGDLYNLVRSQIIRHEGCVLTPYRCPAGKLTIGVGRNLEDRGITEAEAFYLLNNDILNSEQQLVKLIPEIYLSQTENRKVVLLNMAFNMGVYNLLKFKKMFAALKVKNFKKAAEEMLNSKWAKQVGYRANELAEIMENG
jgi:lysozyme